MTARTGFIAVALLLLSTIVFHVVYNLEFWTSEKISLDCGTKAFIFALYGDTFDCVINPCVLLSGAPAVKKAIHKFRIKWTGKFQRIDPEQSQTRKLPTRTDSNF